jgi:hypothetical protein
MPRAKGGRKMARFATWALAAIPALLLAVPAWAAPAAPPTTVPEPVSMTLLATGVAGVAWAKFRRRK